MKVKIANRAIKDKDVKRYKRKLRIRSKISGTASYPRMNFFRSNKNLYIQVINDTTGQTLVSVSTYEKDFLEKKPTLETAKLLAIELGKRMNEKSISKVVFDRNGYKYHGILHAFVDTIRESGIKV